MTSLLARVQNIWLCQIATRKRIFINAFIIFNIAAILLGSSKVVRPGPTMEGIFMPYLRWTRLLQGWLLFVPEPRNFSRKYHVEITFKDGTKSIWQRPYPPKWDFFERHLAYNFQKYDLAQNSLELYEYIRRDLASYIMKLYWNEANPPVTIQLVHSTAFWPEPTNDGPLQYDESTLKWRDYTFATYKVRDKKIE